MNRLVLSIISAIIISATSSAASIIVTPDGGHNRPIIETADASTGLSQIVIIDNAAAARVTFDPDRRSVVTVSSWGASGAAHATPIPAASNADGTYTVTLSAGDTGLSFDVEGDRSYHYWIIDYARHYLDLKSLTYDPAESDCNMAALTFSGNAGSIYYYTINGARRTLSRELKLTYTTLEYNETTDCYMPVQAEKTINAIDGLLHIEQPLCDTSFTIEGDRFTTLWGDPQSISSPTYRANAVSATVSAANLGETPDNMSSSANPTGGLGGSAPAEIRFAAAVTDAVVFNEWQISISPDFVDINYRFASPEVTYTFTEYGTLYARFVCANESGDCQFISQTFDINIGASRLVCPNAFSPADQNGVNDEWRVSYASLVEFECNIFNSWGVHIIKLTDPSQGWDGRFGGKFVPSGVYYYVIRAKGADGIEYKLGGDINVINSRIKPGVVEAE